jgi:hypothetical protein
MLLKIKEGTRHHSYFYMKLLQCFSNYYYRRQRCNGTQFLNTFFLKLSGSNTYKLVNFSNNKMLLISN